MIFKLYIISNLLTSGTALLLGLFVFSKNPKRPLNISWLGLSLSITIYCAFFVLHICSNREELAVIWGRLLTVGSILISPFFLLYSVNLIEKLDALKKIVLISFICATLLLLGLSTNLIIQGAKPSTLYNFYAVPGKFYPLFLFYFFFNLALAHYYLIRSLKNPDSKKRSTQIKYTLLASCIGFFAGSSTFFPLYNISFMSIFSLLTPLYPIIITIAIVKHQLMDIEVVIRRAAVFAGLFAFTYGIFSITTFFGQHYLETIFGWSRWFSMVPTVIFIIFMLRPMEQFLTAATEQFLFQKKYDYRDLLKTFTSEVLTLLDFQKLLDSTVQGLNRIIKLESCSVILLNFVTGYYELKSSYGVKNSEITFSTDDTLVYYLNASHGPIQKDQDIKKFKGNGSLLDDFRRLNADLCLPILLHDRLIGFISLGRKKSGEAYNQEDIDVLMSLARTEAIAISNAQLFQELSKTQAEAAQREKMAVIGTLAAGINHEICNPLGIARGQCEMFLLNYQDGLYKDVSEKELVEKCTIIFEKVIKEVDRATGITKRLSSFAKPAKQFMLGEVDLNEEVQEILAILGHELRLDNIEVVTNIPKEIPKIFADKKQIQEIIFNIVRNAAQAITGKGQIALSATERNDRVFIEIEDSGSGIPPDKINEIFNPFYTTKAPGKGTGLGLFIVKQIVERNKGTIAVQSEVGKGTRFTLSFAVARQMAAA